MATFDPSRVLVFGANGQLARSYRGLLPQATFLSSKDCDLSLPGSAERAINKVSPALVINCSAYTLVDKAEEEIEAARQLNTLAPKEMARACLKAETPLVHYSTDYVFDGRGEKAFLETDSTGPLGVYGETKLEGEKAISAVGCRHLIFRTSWVFSEFGHNFVLTMLRLGKELETLKVVDDQVGAPSYAPHLAEATLKVLSRDSWSSGIYHMTGAGEVSWKGFAEKIFELGRAKGETLTVNRVSGIPTAEYPTAAVRPLNSRLDLRKLKSDFGIEMPSWRQGLEVCMERIYGG